MIIELFFYKEAPTNINICWFCAYICLNPYCVLNGLILRQNQRNKNNSVMTGSGLCFVTTGVLFMFKSTMKTNHPSWVALLLMRAAEELRLCLKSVRPPQLSSGQRLKQELTFHEFSLCLFLFCSDSWRREGGVSFGFTWPDTTMESGGEH